jgi:hypothetical protein
MIGKEKFRTEVYDQANGVENFRQEMVLVFVLEGSLEVSVETLESCIRKKWILLPSAAMKRCISR